MEIKKIRAIRHGRPKFRRQDSTYRNKVADDFWRKPRGRHSKMRNEEAGKKAIVKVGYGSPKEIKYLHVSGLEFARVENLAQLGKVTKSQIVLLSGTVGNKNRLAILKAGKEKGLKFANITDVDKEISNIENNFKARKEAKASKKKVEAKPAETKKHEAKKETKKQ